MSKPKNPPPFRKTRRIKPLENQLNRVTRSEIFDALCLYRSDLFYDESGDGLGLIDILSPFESIKEGSDEIESITDYLYNELTGNKKHE